MISVTDADSSSKAETPRRCLRLQQGIVGLVAMLLTSASMAAVTTPPNILLILADDLGYGEITAFNPHHNKVPTPHLDRLAREGMVMTDMHSPSSLCTPTRYGLLTGRYAWRTHLQSGVLWGLSAPLIPADRLTVGSMLQRAGYDTAAFGKWHLGFDWPGGTTNAVEVDDVKIDYRQPVRNGPTTRGFDSFFGISASLDMAPYVIIENDRVRTPPTFRQTGWFRPGIAAADFQAVDVLPELTARVVTFLQNRSSESTARPFFIYHALPSPHTPFVVAPEWKGRSGISEYADFVMQTDDAIGQVLAALDQSGLAQRTLVLVTSDNGCAAKFADAPALEKAGHKVSAHFRGAKSDLWEGGHRVPFIARWPLHIAAGSSADRTTCLTDLLATVAELIGTKLPSNAGEDSESFLPTLLGHLQKERAPVVHHSANGQFALRSGPWKLLLAPGSGGWSAPNDAEAKRLGMPAVQLYNLDSDPGEQTNLAISHPEKLVELGALLGGIVASGRSTPGDSQTNDVEIKLLK